MTLISFLGPKGTFTHQAANIIGDNLIPYCTIPAVMESVESDETFFGVVPIENSLEGGVGITLDSLANKFDLNIYKEIIMPINQNLIVNKGCSMNEIVDIYSHQQAIGQCREFILENNIQPHYVVSTAHAVKKIIGDKTKAAIGNKKACELYGLEILKSNIQDNNNNETRFIVVSKKEHKITGKDKTSIIFSIYEDYPGGLYDVLGIFQKNCINLTKIESRPSKKGLGKYLFFIDFVGHKDDPLINDILYEIEGNTSFLKILGSYPKL